MAARSRAAADAAKPKAKSDAYTGMLGLSLGILMIGCLLLYMDMHRYSDKEPPRPQASDVVAGANPPAANPNPANPNPGNEKKPAGNVPPQPQPPAPKPPAK